MFFIFIKLLQICCAQSTFNTAIQIKETQKKSHQKAINNYATLYSRKLYLDVLSNAKSFCSVKSENLWQTRHNVSFSPAPDTVCVFVYENSSENSVAKCFMSNEICAAVDSRKWRTFVIPEGRRRGKSGRGQQGTWSTATVITITGAQTHALTAVCHASCELCRTALQMWFHFNYPWREVQTAAATKSLYPSTGLSVMSVCPAVCLAVCHSVFVYGWLSACQLLLSGNISLWCSLCCSLVATLQSAADNVAYVQFPQFPLLPHTDALIHTHTDREGAIMLATVMNGN